MCTTLVVGRNRSATGHVLLAHSEELGRNAAHKVSVVPGRDVPSGERFPLYSSGSLDQPGHTARHLVTRIFDKQHYPGDHTSGINEHGVAVANNMAMMRDVPEARMYEVIPGGIIWTEFLQLALERATSARQGAALVEELAGRHGLSCDSGTMIAIADPDEAWWVELARDGLWAAERVGDEEVSVRANCYRIGARRDDDAGSAKSAPGLAAHAASRGWPSDSPLRFADTVGDPANQSDRYNLDRHEVLEERLRGRKKVGVPDLVELLREVFEGTPLQRARPDGSPFRTGVRTVARMNTEVCTILEPRRGMPPEVAHRMWCCMSTSLTGTFVPFHLGITSVEPHYATAGGRYDPGSAYWLFTELAKLVDCRYRACAEVVLSRWASFEKETLPALAAVENRLAGAGLTEAVEALTAFDEQRAAEAIRVLQELLVEVKTRAFFEDF
ncbi:MAG: C69 family dipeptidase [Myxococcales bacterium]|nr:C69 family dipeptidase [Myxococcales bacterium]